MSVNLVQVFRILGDVSHALSKGILIWAIHSNSSAEGVSLLTQAFYSVVFFSRYMDLFRTFTNSGWNTSFKIFYILSSLYVLFLMLFVYARTREREKAWKLGGLCFGISAVGAPVVMLIFRHGFIGFEEVCFATPLVPTRVTYTDQLGGTGGLDLLDHARIRLCAPAAPPPSADNCSNRHR